MRKMKKSVLSIILIICLLTGCEGSLRKGTIEDVNDLEGRTVGVALAWGPDYLLTGRDDMELIRYNTISTMITALCYHRLDAIAVEKPYTSHILSCVEGLRMVEEPIASAGIEAYVTPGKPELLEEFNTFLAEFTETEAYADILRRLQADGEFEPMAVEMTGGNKKIKVGVISDNYPFTYINFKTGEYEGCDIEMILHFANACGYEVEFSEGSYEANELAVAYGRLDMSASGYSELYREDVELSGFVLVTDAYLPSDIVFLEIDPSKKVRILSAIDY